MAAVGTGVEVPFGLEHVALEVAAHAADPVAVAVADGVDELIVEGGVDVGRGIGGVGVDVQGEDGDRFAVIDQGFGSGDVQGGHGVSFLRARRTRVMMRYPRRIRRRAPGVCEAARTCPPIGGAARRHPLWWAGTCMGFSFSGLGSNQDFRCAAMVRTVRCSSAAADVR